MVIKTKQSKQLNIVCIIFTLFVIINGGTMLRVDHSTICAALLLGSFLLLYLICPQKTISKLTFIYPLSYLFLLLIQVLLGIDNKIDVIVKNFFLMFSVFVGVDIMHRNNIPFLKLFRNIVVFFTLASSVIYILQLIGVNFPHIFIEENSSYSIFYLNYWTISNGWAGSGISIPRLSGVFWEPGLNAIYCNYVLLHDLFINDEKPNWKIIGFELLAVVFTLSPTGYASAFTILTIYVFLKAKKLRFKIISIIAYIIILILVLPQFSSMFLFKTTTNSYQMRTTDFELGWQTIRDNFLFGTGESQEGYLAAYNSLYGISRGNTNGLISIGIKYGFIGYLFYFSIIYYSLKKFAVERGKSTMLCFLAWLLISLITEPIEHLTTFHFLICGGLCSGRLFNVEDKLIWEGELHNKSYAK